MGDAAECVNDICNGLHNAFLRLTKNGGKPLMRNTPGNNHVKDDMGERLRRARINAGYATGSNAARACGFKVSTYLGHENGDRQISRRAALRYARAFHVEPGYLLYAREETQIQTAPPGIDPGAMTLTMRLVLEKLGLPRDLARSLAQALTGSARALSGLPDGALTEDRARASVESLMSAFAPKRS